MLLLEKSPRLGTKILISGGGKCNITHDGHIRQVLKAFRPEEAKFLAHACFQFPNTAILEMLTSRGLEVYTRPDGRIFPVDATAKDVVAILERIVRSAGVDVRLKTPVSGLEARNGKLTGYYQNGEFFPASKIILSTGGSSYPNTGTTGDGYSWAQSIGHTIVKIRAALAPIVTKWDYSEFAGVALRNVMLKARNESGKEIDRFKGDMLFAHRTITGPAVLEISRAVAEWLEKGKVSIEVDLLPDLNFEQVNEAILQYTREFPKRKISRWVETIAPDAIVPSILEAAEIPENQGCSNLKASARNQLVQVVKALGLGEAKEAVLEKGEVVAGGISLDEVDPKTMHSTKVSGLYCCGEVLNISGPVGGYNLQAAFSTGYVAATSAVASLENS